MHWTQRLFVPNRVSVTLVFTREGHSLKCKHFFVFSVWAFITKCFDIVFDSEDSFCSFGNNLLSISVTKHFRSRNADYCVGYRKISLFTKLILTRVQIKFCKLYFPNFAFSDQLKNLHNFLLSVIR